MRVEASSAAMATAQDLGSHLAKNQGAAIIIDYGHNHHSSFSLRVSSL
jgi:SAM-dependent MidA family methyltransferase